MGKGYIKLYRSEADLPQLWENNAAFAVYQKLKIVALWPEGTISKPIRVLARQCAMSVNTLRKAVDVLAGLGLVSVGTSAKNTWSLRVKYVEPEIATAQIGQEIGPETASGVNLLTTPKEPTKTDLSETGAVFTPPAQPDFTQPAQTKSVSKNDTEPGLYQNLTQVVSKNDTTACQNLTRLTLYRNIDIEYNNINPHNPPTQLLESGFTAFWNAYPNKKGKQPAIKKWLKGKFDLAVILPALEKQKKLRAWVKDNGQYIPHATTYLNQRRWEDVLPTGEEHYIVDFKNPTTEREVVLRVWLERTNPELLENDNQQINSTFEAERALFEQLVVRCGGSLEKTYGVLKHGWQIGCTTLRAILERAGSYLDDLQQEEK